MILLKKEKRELRLKIEKKKNKPIEYELWVKIKCPVCSKGLKIKNHLYISMPWRDLPNEIRCYKCNESIDISDIKENGIEITRR